MELFKFQKESVHAVIHKYHGRALVALDMGLGKTPIAIACMKFYNKFPIVVVCPASLRLNWAMEIFNWSGFRATVIRKGTDQLRGDIIIVSYETATKRALDIAMLNPFMVVLDESHYIKNRSALRTKQLIPVCRRAKSVLLLTGTPILNRPVELWSQLTALNVGFAGDFFQFARRYCNAHKTRFGWDFTGATNVKELNEKLLIECMVRRLKGEVLSQLPEKRRSKILVDAPFKSLAGSGLGQLCESALKASKFNIGKALERLKMISNKDISSALFKCYAELGQKKLQQAAEIAINVAEQEPVVIFAHHRVVTHGLRDALMRKGIVTALIDGETPLDARQEAIDGFQTGKYGAIVCSITAASTGITLTRASQMIIAELPWSPGVAIQAEDRIHRIGQNRAVSIQYLVAAGTLDEAIWKALNRKASVGHSILDGHAKSEFHDVAQSNAGTYWGIIESMLEDAAKNEQLTLNGLENEHVGTSEAN